MLVRTRRIGIVNIIADRSVCPEFIQRAARPAAIAAALSSISRDGAARSAMLAGYADIARRLGPPGAAERAAEIVLEELTGPRQPAVHRSLT
jgi:lipid-A-disaccharide synthase